ncbi:MAG: hypothetical protein methR_P0886 [Methyloprofundus sp.]|nr:MAG: hypothetical protein methR_P0886 [Methyloprofundus sp.]
MHKPFSQSCENNKHAILQVIQPIFAESKQVWEIGSGRGQHACYFAEHLPHLLWQATDRSENLAGINSWLQQAELSNLPPALVLDVLENAWPSTQIEALFTANTLHIMPWRAVQRLFVGLDEYLTEQAVVCIYGPFNYNGAYTSASNAQFDQWLKSIDPLQGIRNFDAVINLANSANLALINDFAMPANNRLLVLRKLG